MWAESVLSEGILKLSGTDSAFSDNDKYKSIKLEPSLVCDLMSIT